MISKSWTGKRKGMNFKYSTLDLNCHADPNSQFNWVAPISNSATNAANSF